MAYELFVVGGLLSMVYGFSFDNLPWSYDTVPLIGDIAIANVSEFTEYEAQFIAEHYYVATFAKCTGSPQKTGIPTETAFYEIASKIRKYGSTDKIKLLFYFAVDVAPCVCYNITKAFCNNESMFLRDDYGNIVMKSPNIPYYDHRQQYVRDYWANGVASVMTTALQQGLVVNGLFADGAAAQAHLNSNFSDQSKKQYQQGVFLLMEQVMKTFDAINDDLMCIVNGLDPFNGADTHIMPRVDGMLGDHYMAHEEVIDSQGGKINVTDLLNWYNISKALSNGVYGANKTLFIKGWVGPETGSGGPFGPVWPSTYDAPTPTTHDGVRNASVALIAYPLATFLCGIYNKYVYFSYSWFWRKEDGWVPCPEDPHSCSAPIQWYPEFTNKLGKPLADGIMTDTTKCTRSFEHAKVYVDLNDRYSADIQWFD